VSRLEAPVAGRVGVLAVVRRELRRWVEAPIYPMLLLVLPLAAFGILVVIFQQGVPRDLPLAICDQDGSALSRLLVRQIDATPSLAVAAMVADPAAGHRLLREGKVYGVVLLPAGLARGVRRGEAPAVVGWYNAQLMLPASLVARDLRQVVGTVSAGIEWSTRTAAGRPPRAARLDLEPVRVDMRALFNPQLSYVTYLLSALLPTMLQIFVLIGAVQALGSELKDRTADRWLAVAGGSTWRAAWGKLLPQTISFTLLGMLMLLILFRWLAIPLRGAWPLLPLGTLLFVAAYQAVGLLMVAWAANLRLATSLASFYAGPAFAFVGITYPTFAMPLAAQVYSALLPLTHYLRLVVEQAIRGAAAPASLPELGVLALFVAAAPVLALPRLARVLRDPGAWGRS
jgi:ABC-2 type transport system permease protein